MTIGELAAIFGAACLGAVVSFYGFSMLAHDEQKASNRDRSPTMIELTKLALDWRRSLP